MKLIAIDTLVIEEFVPEQAPEYGILSHRWQGRELTFQDLQNRTIPSDPPKEFKQSVDKIKSFCKLLTQQKEHDPVQYAWVDTVCIDKSSSAELSEAINSMFRIYSEALVCYIYLCDIQPGPEQAYNIATSEWFSRGWTLQELLAPNHLIFWDRDWKFIQSFPQAAVYSDYRKAKDIEDQVIQRTGIGSKDLGFTLSQAHILRQRSRHLSNRASIATKMSWASNRLTTRGEDMAYCLLGLFEVNMPLLYGEGKERAFIRLQQAIILQSPDASIFAWKDDGPLYFKGSMLADSVTRFVDSGDIEGLDRIRPPYETTHRGLKIELELGPIPHSVNQDLWDLLEIAGGTVVDDYPKPYRLAKLDCKRGEKNERPLTICLFSIARWRNNEFDTLKSSNLLKTRIDSSSGLVQPITPQREKRYMWRQLIVAHLTHASGADRTFLMMTPPGLECLQHCIRRDLARIYARIEEIVEMLRFDWNHALRRCAWRTTSTFLEKYVVGVELVTDRAYVLEVAPFPFTLGASVEDNGFRSFVTRARNAWVNSGLTALSVDKLHYLT